MRISPWTDNIPAGKPGRQLYPSLLLFVLALLLLAGCADKPEKHWKLTTQSAYSASISPDGAYVVVGSVLHGGSLWRLSDNERLFNWNHTAEGFSQITATTFSTDSRFALTAEKFRMVLWDRETGKDRGFWQLDAGIRDVALSEQGVFLLAGLDNYTIQYIDTRNGAILRTLTHDGRVNSVDISANGRVGVSGAEDGMVKIWNLLEGKPLHQFRLGDDIATVAISRDGRIAFGALYYGKGVLWDVASGKQISEIGYSRNTLTAARFTPDGNKLITGDAVRRVIIWDVQSGKLDFDRKESAPFFFQPSGRVVVDVNYDPANSQIHAVFSDGSVSLWR